MSNRWIDLMIVPQLGGRLMQVTFGSHPYLFVNPKYRGQYLPPAEAARSGHWINYGGDKLWPLPEGEGDPQHWPGPISDQLDDGEYRLTVLSQGSVCSVRLEGPFDPTTGLQYSREIRIEADSPQISFHAVMKNASGHPIRWSVQSVTQYDTGDARDRAKYNHDFWAFAPINLRSVYFGGYLVRAGLADDPSFAVNNGWFTLHWLYLENEVWLDSDAGWIAVVDAASKFAMMETFQHFAAAEYPGKASIIFYKNGAALELDSNGMPKLRSANPQQGPYYMEAEINSPMISLNPEDSYALDTNWYPVRLGKTLSAVTKVGVVASPLTASFTGDGIRLSGELAVFFPGTLVLHSWDAHGSEVTTNKLLSVDPLNMVVLDQIVRAPGATRLTIHLLDIHGVDRGSLGEAQISK